ncbi:unnamed protein product [Moneuplotes crassus]|uniref:Uncharacterized protein n=1 Tax=Euplotes crassus TaxID=5936 RepID=A0AAD1Y8M4_EUPCR|nr:unnamed protein product [Moneuplotes crassus]
MESHEQRVTQSRSVDSQEPTNKETTEKRRKGDQIEQESAEINAQLYQSIYLKMWKYEPEPSKRTGMSLSLDRYRDLKLTQVISKVKIPVMSSLGLIQADFENKHFRNFVAKSTPIATKSLCIYRMRREKKLRNLNLLFNCLITTPKMILIHQLRNISLKQLKRLFASCKHSDSLRFVHCTFSLPSDLDFSDCFRGTTLMQLNFNSCTMVNQNDTDEKFHELESLISGLAKSPDLKKSLELVKIHSSRHSSKLCELTLAKYGFPPT